MDTTTMFTLQYHHQSFNSTITTSGSSSRSSTEHHTTHHQQQPPQQCFFMDEDDLSSSSSIQPYYSPNPLQPHDNFHHHLVSTTTTTTPQPLKSHGFSQDDVVTEFSNSLTSNCWSRELLYEAARALADNNSSRLQQLLWMLNELSSPYGDINEKLSFYFLQALFSRMTESGDSNYQTLSSASTKICTFESTRNLLLKFQEVSPWTAFGHVASNSAIMDAFEGETKLHIVDISNTYCTQWPTLLEAIATRVDDTPHLRLTVVITTGRDGIETVMREIANRMGKFARLMGIPFKFNILHHTSDLSYLNLGQLDIQSNECLAINLNGTLRSVSYDRRDYLLSMFQKMNPKVLTIVEEEAELYVGNNGVEFLRGFQECLRWFSVYFEGLDESFLKTSNERLMLEREAGRAVMDVVGRRAECSVERRERAERWWSRMRRCGFEGVSISEEGCDDVRALLRRYKEGWSMVPSEIGAGILLVRKETPVVWASAWKPIGLL